MSQIITTATPGWPLETVEALVQLWNQGLTAPEVGARIGKTARAVECKVHKLRAAGHALAPRRAIDEPERVFRRCLYCGEDFPSSHPGNRLCPGGLESGDADILKRVSKGASPRAIITGLGKARDAGLKISAMVILGLGGRNHWREHIDGTAAGVNETAPTYLSTLQLGLDPIIKDEFLQRFGEPFEPQDAAGMLVEQQHLVAQLDPRTPVIFRSNHASNSLPLAGTLPKDRDALLAALGAAQAGDIPLRPTYLRGH